MPSPLTKEACKLLHVLYLEYKARRRHGLSINDSAYFGDSTSIYENFMSSYIKSDVEENISELKQAHFIDCHYADDEAQDCILTSDARIFMENHKIDTAKDLLELVSKFPLP